MRLFGGYQLGRQSKLINEVDWASGRGMCLTGYTLGFLTPLVFLISKIQAPGQYACTKMANLRMDTLVLKK